MAPSKRLELVLSRADVHPLHEKQIRRKVYDKFEKFIQTVIDKENFFVLLEGAAGTGKTNLLRDLLWNRSDICGHYFKKIAWVTDRNLDVSRVADLGLDAFRLLSDGQPLNSIGSSDQTDSISSIVEQLRYLQRPQTIRIVLSQFLSENPQTLIIIDDVYLKETVDLFANLKCSIIATSTRPEAFTHIDRCQSFHLNSDDVYEEDVKSLCLNYGIDSIGEHSAREIIRLSGGNFALMEKLLETAKADTQKLQTYLDRLQYGELDFLKCNTYYQYDSLNTCFDIVPKVLDHRFIDDLPTLAVLQPSTWIDIEIVSLVWPVDTPGSAQTNIAHLVSKDMNTLAKNSLLEHQTGKKPFEKANQTRIDPLFHYYLISTTDQQTLVNTLAFFKRDLQKEKNSDSDVERSFRKYWIDNEANLQQLETILKRPKRRAGTLSSGKSTLWPFTWFANLWSS